MEETEEEEEVSVQTVKQSKKRKVDPGDSSKQLGRSGKKKKTDERSFSPDRSGFRDSEWSADSSYELFSTLETEKGWSMPSDPGLGYQTRKYSYYAYLFTLVYLR